MLITTAPLPDNTKPHIKKFIWGWRCAGVRHGFWVYTWDNVPSDALKEWIKQYA